MQPIIAALLWKRLTS